MGVNVELRSESGDCLAVVLDPSGLTDQLISSADARSVCLRFVDSYGDTIFNRIQLPELIQELEQAAAQLTSDEARTHASRILELARSGLAEPHLYLAFVGD